MLGRQVGAGIYNKTVGTPGVPAEPKPGSKEMAHQQCSRKRGNLRRARQLLKCNSEMT